MGKGLIGFLHIENAVVERDAYYYLALNGQILFFTFFNTSYARLYNIHDGLFTALLTIKLIR